MRLLGTHDLRALADAPGARKHAIHLEDSDDPEARVGEIIVCDGDMVLGPVLQVIQALAAALLEAQERLVVLEEQMTVERDAGDITLAGAAACIEALQALRDTLQADIERRQRWATTGRWA